MRYLNSVEEDRITEYKATNCRLLQCYAGIMELLRWVVAKFLAAQILYSVGLVSSIY